jgi:hypothetical protein
MAMASVLGVGPAEGIGVGGGGGGGGVVVGVLLLVCCCWECGSSRIVLRDVRRLTAVWCLVRQRVPSLYDEVTRAHAPKLHFPAGRSDMMS